MIGKCSFPDCDVTGNLAAIIFHPQEILACDDHSNALSQTYIRRKRARNVNLGQTVDRSTHIDKKTGREITHRITEGKKWEIDNRRLSQDDGVTVVNRATGKPAQY